jgi:hypothetical protein
LAKDFKEFREEAENLIMKIEDMEIVDYDKML